MSLFKRIKSLCDNKGIRIEELSTGFGWGENSIYRWDKNSPSIDKVKMVADYFNVTIDSLLADSYTRTEDENDQEELKKFIARKGNEPYIILSAKAKKQGISPEVLQKLIDLYTK
jgi:transcriptional regulator with XRE-family HTH domain